MSAPFDLAGYLDRIGYDGPRAPTLAALREIHARHAAAIPFENLDPLLGRPVELDVPSLERKMVRGRRGGYCFEQNTLLAAALDALGFDVTRLAARVRWNAPPDRPEGPRSHMLLRVVVEGRAHVADVGFGGYVFSGPLEIAPGREQSDFGNRLRFVESGGSYTLQLLRADAWTDVYRFAMEPQFPADYAVSNWWTSTHPSAIFTTSLLAERVTPAVRYTLFNARLTTRYPDGRATERTLSGPSDLAEVLGRAFEVDPPAAPADIWAKLPRS